MTGHVEDFSAEYECTPSDFYAASDEPELITAAEAAELLRKTKARLGDWDARHKDHYQDATGWRRKHDVYGGPHDAPSTPETPETPESEK